MSRPSLPGNRAGFPEGRVMGKEFVGAIVAFRTNDFVAVRLVAGR